MTDSTKPRPGRLDSPVVSKGIVERYADFAAYQTWTDREIPVVALEPR